jgi:hypothetical protein
MWLAWVLLCFLALFDGELARKGNPLFKIAAGITVIVVVVLACSLCFPSS